MTTRQTDGLDPAIVAEIEARRAAEDAHLRRLKAAREDCDCKDGMFAGVTSRRGVLAGFTAAAAGLAASAARAGEGAPVEGIPPGAKDFPVPDTPWKSLGPPVNRNGGYGSRSQFETEVRWRYPTATDTTSWSMTPLGEGMGIVTPSGLHFERHHAGVAVIDPSHHRLLVHGMVDRPLVFDMASLRRYPAVSRMHFIECSGNGLTEWKEPTLKTVQGTHGLTSTSEWTGVPLSTLLAEAGVQDGAAWILAEGADGAMMTRSIPIDKAWDDALLAYGQNGEMLRPEQGYPLRLLLPGWEGNTHIKWLRRLEISDKPFMTREETSKYTDTMPDGRSRQFSMVMEAKSVITFPSGEMKLPKPGFYEVTGIAWSGRGRIQAVEVSADGGRTWAPAMLDGPALPICHTRFRFPWRWDGQPAILQSRCIDETGYVQPTIAELVKERGLNSVYHLNGIQSWKVDSDGSVTNVHA
ncbi:sulfite dehydrogenase [Caenispirillum salinarum]|uniref:sulfite dehydrogenase n=1 Tax=Caenispirillum salinarum TaxID=859058 RepID=UPI00384D8570